MMWPLRGSVWIHTDLVNVFADKLKQDGEQTLSLLNIHMLGL